MIQSHTTNRSRRRVTRLLCAAGLTVVGIAGTGATGALGATSAGAATPVPDLCSGTTVKPPSTGTETPAGFSIQMPGAVLAPATDANTLAQAYSMWNDMTCTEYTHQYQFAPPKYYYLDCVGFTGYATEKADPTAWASVASDLHIAAGFVPTPVNFEQFFNDLPTSPQAGWQAVDGVSGIQPGDILAWQPALSNGQPNLAGTGHSVMPLTAPVAIPGSDGTRWELVIMDSTAGGHGPDDTRKPDDPLSERNAPILTTSGQVQPSGLGIGTIALNTTPAGKVTGVEWNVGDPPESIVFGAGHPLDDPSPAPPGPQPVQSSYDIAGANGMVDTTISTGMIGQGVVNFGRILGPAAAAVLMSLWVVWLARMDLQIRGFGRLPLYSLGMILTFNLGRDITLITIYPLLFGALLVYWVDRRQSGKSHMQEPVRRAKMILAASGHVTDKMAAKPGPRLTFAVSRRSRFVGGRGTAQMQFKQTRNPAP